MFRIKSLDIFFILFIFAVLLLGTWQVFRLNLKNNLISTLENNLKKNSIIFNEGIDKEYTKVLLKKKDLFESKLHWMHSDFSVDLHDFKKSLALIELNLK